MAKLTINKEAFKRKVEDAAAKQVSDKLRAKGIRGVKVKPVTEGGKTFLEFSGKPEEIEKAKKQLKK